MFIVKIAALSAASAFFVAGLSAGEAGGTQQEVRKEARATQQQARSEARSAKQSARAAARSEAQERAGISPSERESQIPTSATREPRESDPAARQQQRQSTQAARQQQRADTQQQRAGQQAELQQQRQSTQAARQQQRADTQQQRAGQQAERQQQRQSTQAARQQQRADTQQQRAGQQAELQQQRQSTQAARQQQRADTQQQRAGQQAERQQQRLTDVAATQRDSELKDLNRRRYAQDRSRFSFTDNVRRSSWHHRDRYYGRNWGRWGGHRWHHNDWWRPLGWSGLTGFLSFSIGGQDDYDRRYFGEPVYYSYGGDRFVYQPDDLIVVNEVVVGPAREYSQRSIETARLYERLVGEQGPISVSPDEWKPLGIYALSDASKNVDTADPDRYMELVISKKGAIGGTYHDLVAGEDYPIYGAVDPKTQRAAWMVNSSKNVFETGVYNLTQPETTALHIRSDVTKQVVLIRIQDPQQPAQD